MFAVGQSTERSIQVIIATLLAIVDKKERRKKGKSPPYFFQRTTDTFLDSHEEKLLRTKE